MNKKLVLATVATIAAVGTATGVKADESTGTTTAGNETTAVGNTATREDGNQVSETAGPSEQKEPQGSNATETERGATGEREGTNQNATEVTKLGDQITVKNPDVDMHFTKGATGNGTGKYVNFKVEYKNIDFPDSMTINEGDQVVLHMPKEVSFRTDFDFDVKNPEDQTIGHAQASIEKGTVTTTFNDYFTKHPLNKQMAMTFDAVWTEAVTSGEETTLNFDGTTKKIMVDPEPELDPTTEKFSKWGSQAENDPQVLRWTFRLNLSKQKLENLIIKDRWTDNQEYVEGSLEPFFVDDAKTWTNYTSAKDYLDSFHVLNGGFDLKMKTFDRILYVNYRTRLKTPVKESNDPLNVVWARDGEGDTLADNYNAHIALVGGKGRASGENKPEPTFKIPKESPKVEIPEFQGGIPGIPEVREKPEWQGGTVPFDAPILDKPEINIKDIPMMPPAPVLDKPELVIDIPDPKRDEPKPQPKEDKPNTPAPKTNEDPKVEEVKIVKSREKSSENHAKNESEETVEAYSAPAVLPATGSDLGLSLVALGISVATLAFTLKKKES
ncbi:collagen binding domain-containing protein [Streptococcus parasanguinis]|uniref:collagen binding domain-containing protein n=1 Tax=Streptococcus parasanguinis TaxID=1318 RepID=UPI001BEBF468|nr:collagen binding domain-containing protein [Streptococcus parasanguinis]MBT3138401.1 hypothetical protein [Streptococcus parasanguinis]